MIRVALVLFIAVSCWWLVPFLLVHAPALLGLLGVALLVVALFLPSKPKCEGHHCSGCSNH